MIIRRHFHGFFSAAGDGGGSAGGGAGGDAGAGTGASAAADGADAGDAAKADAKADAGKQAQDEGAKTDAKTKASEKKSDAKVDDKVTEAEAKDAANDAKADDAKADAELEALKARLAELEGRRTEDAKLVERHEQQLAEARKTARKDCLDKLQVLEEYRDLVPDFDLITEAGRAKLQEWVDARPRLVADQPGVVERVGREIEIDKDKPGSKLVDMKAYKDGLEAIERKFGGRGWL